MRLHFTLVQKFHSNTKDLREYLIEQGIKFSLGGNLQGELQPFGYLVSKEDSVVLVYVALIEEYELSAIALNCDGVQIIRNTKYICFKNSVRKFLHKLFHVFV